MVVLLVLHFHFRNVMCTDFRSPTMFIYESCTSYKNIMKFSYNVLSKFMILFWAEFITNLGHMSQATGRIHLMLLALSKAFQMILLLWLTWSLH